jgi:hypothetical protein
MNQHSRSLFPFTAPQCSYPKTQKTETHTFIFRGNLDLSSPEVIVDRKRPELLRDARELLHSDLGEEVGMLVIGEHVLELARERMRVR